MTRSKRRLPLLRMNPSAIRNSGRAAGRARQCASVLQSVLGLAARTGSVATMRGSGGLTRYMWKVPVCQWLSPDCR
ncbi:MAG: hypothetical protein WKG00_31425 [Polyangiaceae bacterium]